MNDRFEFALSLRPSEWRPRGTGFQSINIALLWSEEVERSFGATYSVLSAINGSTLVARLAGK